MGSPKSQKEEALGGGECHAYPLHPNDMRTSEVDRAKVTSGGVGSKDD